jgi:hypothetical protein
MKWMALAFLLLAGQAWGAYAPNTTALYDFEDNLSDTAGTQHATPVGSVTYGTLGVWSGTKTINGAYCTIPATLIGITGTVEFSARTAALANGVVVLGSAQGGARALEIYQFGGQFYAYSAAIGVNAPFLALSSNTNYYIKQTWNASRRIIWGGSWSTAGTVTLTKLTDVANVYMNATAGSSIHGSYSIGAPWDGAIDWFRVRDVFDDSATVTVDPSPYTLPAGWVSVTGLVLTTQ